MQKREYMPTALAFDAEKAGNVEIVGYDDYRAGVPRTAVIVKVKVDQALPENTHWVEWRRAVAEKGNSDTLKIAAKSLEVLDTMSPQEVEDLFRAAGGTGNDEEDTWTVANFRFSRFGWAPHCALRGSFYKRAFIR